ncbi:hypothetical protein BS78_03G105700 [Paspalum vaginatum]|nr:hypothetical protein BS78_03G105700 [Paspalum vaginatum]
MLAAAALHSGLGTVPPLRLRAPRREELWYLFKALAFGGTDPGLVRIAMALFKTILDVAASAVANKVAASQRADQSAASWRRVLKVSAGVTELQLGGAGAVVSPRTRHRRAAPHRPEWKTGYTIPLCR